jgi:hypothetical protein
VANVIVIKKLYGRIKNGQKVAWERPNLVNYRVFNLPQKNNCVFPATQKEKQRFFGAV